MKRRSLSTASAMAIALLMLIGPMILLAPVPQGKDTTNETGIFGLQDAWIIGKVMNAATMLDVSCESIYTASQGSDPVLQYYNGTTDIQGNFNITVDSNPWKNDSYYSPYKVTIFGNYHQSIYSGKDKFIFENATYSGNESAVPNGILEVVTNPLSNLTLTILNGSSGEPLENARVELQYPQGFPAAPFPLAKGTDAAGQAAFDGIRSVNTTVAVTKLNFQPLVDTEPADYVVVQEGGDMQRTFTLIEKPWPFALLGDESDINATENVTINFKQEMDPVSITTLSNFQMWKVDGEVPISFALAAKDSNRKVHIDPEEPLEYDTVYRIRLEPRLRTDGGTFPLWRAMEITFKTELQPGQMKGRIISSSDGSPAENVRIMVLDQTRSTNSTGHFHFSIVPQGTYRLDVLESFLFNDSSLSGVEVDKGEIVVVDDIVIDPKPWGMLEVNVMSGDSPLEGAWIKIIDETVMAGEFNLTTDGNGMAFFPSVRTGAVIMKVGASHHAVRDDMALVYEGKRSYLNITLIEDDIPVWIEATDPIEGEIVDPQSNFLLHVPEPVVFSTINVTMFMTDEMGAHIEEVSLTPPEKQNDLVYIINPPRLQMESYYKITIGSDLESLSTNEEIIWRDVSLEFKTPDFDLSYINGSLLLEGMVLEGFDIVFGDFSDTVDEEGGFNLTIDLSEPSLTGELMINGSSYGYGSINLPFQIEPGRTYEAGDIDLYHIDGWYSVTPEPGALDIDPTASVVLEFMRPFISPAAENWSKVFALIPEGSSAPLPGDYSVLNDNMSVVFTPASEMENNVVHTVRVTEALLQESGLSMFPLGNETSFRIEPPEIRVTIKEPLAGELDSVDLDQPIVITFSSSVDKAVFQANIEVSPEPAGIELIWPTPTEVEIHMLLSAETTYTMSLPVGIYGSSGEPIKTAFNLEFTTTSEYSTEHNLESVQVEPSVDSGWETGKDIKFSGTASNAEGWTIHLVLEKDGVMVKEADTFVDGNGSWTIELIVPSEPGDYDITVTIGVPGGPASDTWTGEVEVREAGASVDDDPSSSDNNLLIALIIVIAVVLIIIAAVVYAMVQRKKAQEEIDSIEYDDIESEWDNEEEE